MRERAMKRTTASGSRSAPGSGGLKPLLREIVVESERRVEAEASATVAI